MSTLPALKVKAKWLRLMRGQRVKGRHFKKTIEVRKYLPTERTPKGQKPMVLGERLFLLAEGRVWCSARLADVVVYDCGEAFATDQEKHCITDETARGPVVEDIKKALGSGRRLYGWRLDGFHWFPPEERPRSGEGGVPDFHGQGKGWVWSALPLPSALDPATLPSEESGDAETRPGAGICGPRPHPAIG